MSLQLRVLKGKGSQPLVRRTLRVGELARRTSKTVRALHLYEEMGLLVPIERSKGGYRLYDADSVTRVRWIAKLQTMGFSLNDIQTMARQWEQSGSAPGAMARVDQLLKEKLDDTREQIQRLQQLEGELQASLDYLRTCPTCDPKQIIDACSACELHADSEPAPELVAGFSAH
jgi:MerR family transcriptional regulator, copper efflux regulator